MYDYYEKKILRFTVFNNTLDLGLIDEVNFNDVTNILKKKTKIKLIINNSHYHNLKIKF